MYDRYYRLRHSSLSPAHTKVGTLRIEFQAVACASSGIQLLFCKSEIDI